jgi:hypothetical protein
MTLSTGGVTVGIHLFDHQRFDPEYEASKQL